jgi:hypothetical protein
MSEVTIQLELADYIAAKKLDARPGSGGHVQSVLRFGMSSSVAHWFWPGRLLSMLASSPESSSAS